MIADASGAVPQPVLPVSKEPTKQGEPVKRETGRETQDEPLVCRHCGKELTSTIMVSGFSIICPSCKRLL